MKKPEVRILAVDIGTTNVKAAVFDEQGHMLSFASKEVPIYSPIPGSAIQRLEELNQAALLVIKTALKRCNFSSVDVLALSAQMHGLAAIDETGKEILPLITYLDTRAGGIMNVLVKETDPYLLYKETGCPPLFVYPLAKLIWLREKGPEVFRKARWFLSIKDYMMFRLIGEPYIDKSVASGSQLLNINTLRWSDISLELAGIDEELLPHLEDGEEQFVELPIKSSRILGLKDPVPIVLGGSDGALHSLGVGSIKRGMLALNLGTSGAIRGISARPLTDASRDMRFFCYYIGYGLRLPGGAVNNAGICLRWFRDSLGQPEKMLSELLSISPYDLLSREAERACAASDGLIVLPFFSGERFPVRDPFSRCVIFGLTLRHGRHHLIRGLMEGVIYTLRWIYEAMEENGLKGCIIRTGGGGSRSRLWRQIQADVFKMPVERTEVEEASLLGAAIMGAIAIGLYKDVEEAVSNMVRVKERIDPIKENFSKYERAYDFFKYLYKTLKQAFRRHSHFSLKGEGACYP